MAIEYDPSEFGSDFINLEPSSNSLFSDDNICGEGASCLVYVKRLGGQRVAIKRLRKELLGSPAYVASYRKEFEIGQLLKHDGLPIYRDFQADGDEVCIMMDYVDGISLDVFLNTEVGRQYFRIKANVERFLLQLLDVVGYLHRSGVVHCDIKPANIMLRNTDRSVMLVDLDKAYCDTFDSTHGGSRGISSPLPEGSTPTAAKDIEAIGNLVDWIESRVAKFPGRRFRRFRKACHRVENSEQLIPALDVQKRGSRIMVTITVVLVLTAVVYVYSGKQADNALTLPTDNATVENTDSVSIEVKPYVSEEKTEAVTASPQTTIGVDFDEQMSQFITEAQSALVFLESGSATDVELRQIVNDVISEGYHERYMTFLAKCKEQFPDIAELDVEIAVARMAVQSRASKLRAELSKAIADTLMARHPEAEEPIR